MELEHEYNKQLISVYNCFDINYNVLHLTVLINVFVDIACSGKMLRLKRSCNIVRVLV
jgi:hypothetical protein